MGLKPEYKGMDYDRPGHEAAEELAAQAKLNPEDETALFNKLTQEHIEPKLSHLYIEVKGRYIPVQRVMVTAKGGSRLQEGTVHVFARTKEGRGVFGGATLSPWENQGIFDRFKTFLG